MIMLIRNIFISVTIFFVLTFLGTYVHAGDIKRDMVPSVAYLSPEDEIVIDLTGKPGITFKWKNSPTPGGGRDSYRFKLIKGFKYDFVVSETLGPGVFLIDVPADKFENGVTYSWYVEQRDASQMVWGRHDVVWSFKVIKK